MGFRGISSQKIQGLEKVLAAMCFAQNIGESFHKYFADSGPGRGCGHMKSHFTEHQISKFQVLLKVVCMFTHFYFLFSSNKLELLTVLHFT